jgi:hypothetical protein
LRGQPRLEARALTAFPSFVPLKLAGTDDAPDYSRVAALRKGGRNVH